MTFAKQVYRHYGNNQFDKTLVKPIKNRETWGKPTGGFWASRVDAENSWKEWCEREEFETHKLKKHFDFTLRDDTKLLEIKTISDLNKLRQEHQDWFVKPKWEFVDKSFLDFEKISKLYDAMEVNAGSDEELYFDFYGWDCDSICIFNLDCVEVI